MALRVVEGHGDGSWADRGSDTSIDEMKEIILSDQLPDISDEDPLRGHESVSSAPSILDSPPGSPISPLGDLKDDYGDEAPLLRPSPSPLQSGAPPQRLFPSLQQSVSQTPATQGLIQDLPGIIKKAADLRGIAMPAEQPAPASELLRRGIDK